MSAHEALVEDFLEDYESSIEFVSNSKNISSAANYIADAGILPNVKIATSALTNLGDSIAYIDGEGMKNALCAFYPIIGVTVPSDAFFYEK